MSSLQMLKYKKVNKKITDFILNDIKEEIKKGYSSEKTLLIDKQKILQCYDNGYITKKDYKKITNLLSDIQF